MEGDHQHLLLLAGALRFLSTPSGWRATVALDTTLTHEGISIHALRVEGDSETNAANSASDAISIHALRVEGDNVFRNF